MAYYHHVSNDTNATYAWEADELEAAEYSNESYIGMAAARLALVIIGFSIIVTYKWRHGIVRVTGDHAAAGLPVGAGFSTLLKILKIAWASPRTGAWILGHGIMMTANTAGALYLIWLISSSGEINGPADAPDWVAAVYTFRSAATILIVPLSALQWGFMAVGAYGVHR